jgi:hypothetical protein
MPPHEALVKIAVAGNPNVCLSFPGTYLAVKHWTPTGPEDAEFTAYSYCVP